MPVAQLRAKVARLVNRPVERIATGMDNQSQLLDTKFEKVIAAISNQSALLNSKLERLIRGIENLHADLKRERDVQTTGDTGPLQLRLLRSEEQTVHESIANREPVANHTNGTNSLAAPSPHRSVLLITLPKSGTVYTQAKLSRGLGLPTMSICDLRFPVGYANPVALQTFRQGGRIAASHLSASIENLTILADAQVRFILHVRDPRAATLSMLHHMVRLYRDPTQRPFLRLIGRPWPDATFYSAELSVQVDWMIDNYLPQAVAWLEDWLSAFATNAYVRSAGSLTTFSQMVADENMFFKSVLEHFSIPTSAVEPVNIDKTMDVHFRNGDDAEWRRVFSPTQQERAGRLLSATIRERFNWP